MKLYVVLAVTLVLAASVAHCGVRNRELHPVDCRLVCIPSPFALCAKNGEGKSKTFPSACDMDFYNCQYEQDYHMEYKGSCNIESWRYFSNMYAY